MSSWYIFIHGKGNLEKCLFQCTFAIYINSTRIKGKGEIVLQFFESSRTQGIWGGENIILVNCSNFGDTSQTRDRTVHILGVLKPV